MKKIFSLSLILTALALEIMPYGAVCNFMTPPGEPPLRKTFSYFSLTPFGYAHFSPFLVAILSCVLLVLIIMYMILGNRLRMPVLIVSAVATLLSFCPLLLGFSYYSVVGLLISLCLVGVTLLTAFDFRKE
ncbi:MAG: hypothetical protein E7581_03065 [Ruminococcaceae bacterium]|nr:hypothetical protein [Oscillospiraceae bacterium]